MNTVEKTQDDCIQRIAKCEVKVEDTVNKLDKVADKLDTVCDRLAVVIGERNGRNRLIDVGIGAIVTGFCAIFVYVVTV